jgi:hypothetical protein
MIAVIGGNGNMGKRYKTILDFLGVENFVVEMGDSIHDTIKDARLLDGIIIATPTETHYKLIVEYSRLFLSVPILCEKPLTMNKAELTEIMSIKGLNLRMINQYEAYFQDAGECKVIRATDPHYARGLTYYNFFNSGKDGAFWDHISIIALSKSTPNIQYDSPIWECWINGKRISKEAMDEAYIWNIDNWLETKDDPKQTKKNHAYIKEAHKKVWELL